MKKHIFLLIFIAFLSSFSSKAQIKRGSFEKIRSFKIAYLTDELNLTENEAQKFWPIYNKYDKKMMQLHREERFSIRKKILSNGGIDSLSEKRSKEIFDRIQAINKQKNEIRTSFHDKVSKILSFKKILTLEISEHEFNRKLMGKHRGKRRKNKKEAK
jgi:Spy/CpxP family protein refolding chaperone